MAVHELTIPAGLTVLLGNIIKCADEIENFIHVFMKFLIRKINENRIIHFAKGCFLSSQLYSNT